jgi:predicted DNA-binding ribbon-helix-helix protein
MAGYSKISLEQVMRSPVVKRSVVISGYKTSVSAEAEFWNALKDIAASQDRRLSDLVTDIDRTRQAGTLSSAIRLFVLDTLSKTRERCGRKPSLRAS